MTKHNQTRSLGNFQTAPHLEQKDFPEIKWVVDDLLPEGLTILAGAPKIGKSFFCLNLALAVSQAGTFLSGYKVSKPKSVLYFALDNDPQRLIQSRLKMIQPDVSLPDNIQLCRHVPIQMSDDGLDTWRETIESHKAELVIVDTLHHVLPQINPSQAYPRDTSILLPIKKMVHRLGISMILVTYTDKGIDTKNPFKSIQDNIQTTCDTIMMLTISKGDKVLHIHGRETLPKEIPVAICNGIFVKTRQDDRE